MSNELARFHELARDEVFRLETPRLWLRWPRAADAPAFCALAGDWDVARMTATIPHPSGREDAEHFIRTSREDCARGAALRLAVTLKVFPRQTIGVVGVEFDAGLPMLGYWLGKRFWGRGVASEAAQAMVDVFFLLADADELGALALEENAASRGLLDKLGFTEVERLISGPGRQAASATLRLALRRRDWQARSRAGLPPVLRSATA